MNWATTYWGMFLTQALCHSVVTLFIVESAIVVLDLRSHLERFRCRLMVMFLPIAMFPLFQFMTPARGTFYFRHDEALLDSLRWLDLEIMGVPVTLGVFAALVLVASAATLVQEIIPFMRGIGPDREEASRTTGCGEDPDKSVLECQQLQSVVADLAGKLGVLPPKLRVLDEEYPVIYTVGHRNPHVVISTYLLETLDRPQLCSALAHELAHIKRQSNAATFLVYLARLMMFFNPVSLLTFRRIVQDDEHICDDITAAATGDPERLAGTLRLFVTNVASEHAGIDEMREAIGDHSHNLLLLERIRRLEQNDLSEDIVFRPTLFVLTLFAVLAVSYYVV